jgi:enoyl-CoA hydratase/carnithine racemase
MNDVIIFQEINCANDKKIGIATLNAAKSLNALSKDMILLLFPQLLMWKNQRDIAAVFLQGEGEKAFCAGGDIVHLYSAAKESQSDSPLDIEKSIKAGNADDKLSPILQDYFTQEYKLDYLIHTFEKPFIVWGSGIVMGGGLGLLAGGSHRIVTETSRIAMPEISIGLFPDVGASYFLNQMPPGIGLFLALTGTSINSGDAKYCQLADFYIEHHCKEQLVEQLLRLNYTENNKNNHKEVTSLLADIESCFIEKIPSSPIQANQSLIENLVISSSLSDIITAVSQIKTEEKWLEKARYSLQKGSVISAQIAYTQLQLGQTMTLAECFKMELNLAVKSGIFGEFYEGVRALLIDKDRQPKWHYSSVQAIDSDIHDWFFKPLWNEQEHPLSTLESISL